MSYSVISLFSGAMGLDLGLEQAGLKVLVGQDCDKACLQTAHLNNKNMIGGDIRNITAEQMLNAVGLNKGEAFLVCGEPPCQPYSTVGKRIGTADPRCSLFNDFVRMIDGIRPRFFVMDNVRGIISSKITTSYDESGLGQTMRHAQQGVGTRNGGATNGSGMNRSASISTGRSNGMSYGSGGGSNGVSYGSGGGCNGVSYDSCGGCNGVSYGSGGGSNGGGYGSGSGGLSDTGFNTVRHFNSINNNYTNSCSGSNDSDNGRSSNIVLGAFDFDHEDEKTAADTLLGEAFAPILDPDLTVLDVIVSEFERIGYKVVCGILDAVNYGSPQFRERLVIIGSRDGEPIFLPEPTNFQLHQNDEYRWRTLWDAIGDLEDYPGVGASFSCDRIRYLDQVPAGGNWRSLPEDVQREAMGGAINTGGGKVGFFRRLSYNEPSPTVVASPNQKSTMLCHPRYSRPLSVREYSRIQGFPDDWIFGGSVSSQYKQIGNAFPVPLGKALGQMLISVDKNCFEIKTKRTHRCSL